MIKKIRRWLVRILQKLEKKKETIYLEKIRVYIYIK